MIGQVRVVVKYSFEENEKNLLSYFKIGYVYLVTNATIIYKLKQNWNEHIF